MVDQQIIDNPDEPVKFETTEVRVEDFKKVIEFAKLFSQLPAEQQVLKIEKPLPSPDIKVWLKESPKLQPFLQELAADKENLFALLIAGNYLK